MQEELDSKAAFVHSHAIVEPGAKLGYRTRVWAFPHVPPGAVIGEDCNVCDHTFVEGKVLVGNRVTIKCGVYLWDGLRIEDDVFIGPSAVFTNAQDWISATIESALQQTWPNKEIIVVDDGSKDKTFAIVQQFTPRGVKAWLQPILGYSLAKRAQFVLRDARWSIARAWDKALFSLETKFQRVS